MPIKCYYEVLGVPRDADDDEIKKAHRKLALQWHPDKNPDRITEATEQFRAVQQAYDVLSDRQERAWYDDHREAILRGGFRHRGADGTTAEADDSLDVYEYFTTSCFSGFTDEEDGFFGVYSKVFSKISEEDLPFLDCTDIDIPTFGNANDSYDDVVGPFYDHWESYCTAKSYCWLDKWDTRDAPNRDVRRLMEAENKKLRDKAKKERNEEVRALVRFVRKRDPRIVARRREVEERNAVIAKKQAEQRRQEAIARREIMAAAAREMNECEPDWTHTDDAEMKELEDKIAKEFGRHSVSEDPDVEEDDPLYCIACDKSFKTEKALINHVKSKKHVDRVTFVRSQLGEDDDNSDDEMASQILHRLNLLESKAAECSDTNNSKKSGKGRKKGRQQKSDSEESSDGETIPNPENDLPSVSNPVSDDVQQKVKVKTRPKTSATTVPTEDVQKCQKCGEIFSSRNKMFQHLTTTGHAQPPKPAPPVKSSKKTKSSKGK